MLLACAATYVLLINLAAWFAFAADKRAAQTGAWRVPEGRLLMLAAVGGSVGAVLAQQALRHKTRKQPFRALLIGIVAVQIVAVVASPFWWPSP